MSTSPRCDDDSSLDIAQNGSDKIIVANQSGGTFYNSTNDTDYITQNGTANSASVSQR